MMSDEERARFDAWCREEAADIRNYAAAHGQTAEYVYLKRTNALRATMREKFPGVWEGMTDSVERECYNEGLPLDLAAINEYRARWDYPALGVIPPLRLREEYMPPMPGDVPGPATPPEGA